MTWPGDDDVLLVAGVADLADLVAVWGVDSDLGADVALRVERQRHDLPVYGAHVAQLVE